jgi:glutamine amidotransferase PdxT
VKAGVLALQGDFREHARVFGELGASPVEVRTPDDLARLDPRLEGWEATRALLSGRTALT